jgi:hypothetical protein
MGLDEELASIPSTWSRHCPVERLIEGNFLAKLEPQNLAEMLLKYRTASAEWRYRDLFCAIGKRISLRFGLLSVPGVSDRYKFDALDDSKLVELAVSHGTGFAIGAAWYSKESDLLWAAAAALTKFHGCTHTNQIAHSDKNI